MPRYRQSDIDLVALEGEGFHVHCLVAGEFIGALMHRLTRDLIWDHAPEFTRVLDRYRKPGLASPDMSAITDIDNSGGSPC